MRKAEISCGRQKLVAEGGKLVAEGRKHWRMAGNTGGRQETLAEGRKHWRMAGNTSEWQETLADGRKCLADSRNYYRIATTILEMNIF